jgi:REP element-mobilizing transposase RayT
MLVPGRDFDFFNPYSEIQTTRANLPHWRQPRVLYFVTFRLADSIPKKKLNDWRILYNDWLKANPKPWNEKQAEEYEKDFARRIELWLDAGHGSCCLKDKLVKQIIADCIQHTEPEHYCLDAWTIASNHVHVLVAPADNATLPEIMKSWKGITARRINTYLARTGTLWQKEYYDHIVRNATALERVRKYITNHKT